MVTPFKGWQAEDGTIFKTQNQALQHEAILKFKALLLDDGCNEGQINKLASNFEAYAKLFSDMEMERNEGVAPE